MTRYRSLDLQNGSVICALVALDAELCEFHYLCAELGPFFKFFFDEFTTDAYRKGLHRERMPGCLAVQEGIPAHVSHYGRDYWKPQIEKKQILAIQELFIKFKVKWHELYSHFNAKFYFPQTEPSVTSPWTVLNTQFMNLATNICAICSQLTNTQDLFLAVSDSEPKYTVTVIRPTVPSVSGASPETTLSHMRSTLQQFVEQ